MAHIASEEQINGFIFSTIFKGRANCGNNPISNTFEYKFRLKTIIFRSAILQENTANLRF